MAGLSTVPGGILCALAAKAAYETVSDDFYIDTLQAHFLSGAEVDRAIRLHVQRLSDTGRFATRVVSLKQDEAIVVHVTCSFIRKSAMQGPSMKHSVSRATRQKIDKITLDDFAPIRTDAGPWLKYQRFPLTHTAAGEAHEHAPPQSFTYTSVGQVSPPIATDGHRIQSLGIIALSDYHVLDCPPTLHGLSFGTPGIGDESQASTENDFKLLTSLNHSIIFHVHDGFRADELCYIEANSPWAAERRAEIQSRIFSNSGNLLATCKQEGYYVLKDEPAPKL